MDIKVNEYTDFVTPSFALIHLICKVAEMIFDCLLSHTRVQSMCKSISLSLLIYLSIRTR